MNGDKIIQEEEVEVCPEKVSASCLDENVCLESCRKYCSKDAWMVINSVVDTLQKEVVHYCGRCTCPIYDDTQSSLLVSPHFMRGRELSTLVVILSVCHSVIMGSHFQVIKREHH